MFDIECSATSNISCAHEPSSDPPLSASLHLRVFAFALINNVKTRGLFRLPRSDLFPLADPLRMPATSHSTPSFRTILFDLDGTLIDHFAAIHRTHAHVMRSLGLPEPTFEQVHRAIGGGLDEAVRRLVGPLNETLVPEACRRYREYWEEHMYYGVALLPGAAELLRALHGSGIITAVFTNKHGPSARLICEHLGVTPHLHGIFGAFDTPWLKPEREFADHALKTLGVTAADALLIGDSTYDIDAARNAGFPSWCVTTGTHSAAELSQAGAHRIFSDLPAIHREFFP